MPLRPVRATSLLAVAGLSAAGVSAAALAIAAPAHAGWSAARTSPVPAGLLGVGATANGGGELAVSGLGADARYFAGNIPLASGTRFGPFVGALSGLSDVQAVATDGTGGAAIAYSTGPGSGLVLVVRDPGGTFSAPIVLESSPYAIDRVRMDMNARGDVALAWTGGSEVPGVKVLVRPRGGVPTPRPVLGDAAIQPSVTGIDINERGEVAVGWVGIDANSAPAQAVVLQPDGAVSPLITLGPPGSRAFTTAVAVDDRGTAVAAAAVSGTTATALNEQTRGELRIAQRRAGASWGPARALDQRADGSSVVAAAGGSHAVVAWAGPGSRGPVDSPSRTRIAARSGSGALRPAPLRAVGAGDSGVSRVAAAVGPTGTAAVLTDVGGAIRAYTRPAGRRSFGAPRVLSPLSGGSLPLVNVTSDPGRPVAVAGRRVVAAWSATRGGVQVRGWKASGSQRARPAVTTRPRSTSTPPVLDRRTTPPTLRTDVRCDRPCRVDVSVRLQGRGSSFRAVVSRVLPRAGRASVAAPLTPLQVTRLERVLERGRIRSATASVTAATRSGSTLTRDRALTILPAPPA